MTPRQKIERLFAKMCQFSWHRVLFLEDFDEKYGISLSGCHAGVEDIICTHRSWRNTPASCSKRFCKLSQGLATPFCAFSIIPYIALLYAHKTPKLLAQMAIRRIRCCLYVSRNNLMSEVMHELMEPESRGCR